MAKKKKKVRAEKKLRGDFYLFQRKIARLEELKRELQSLQAKGMTKGFEKDVSLMRSRLKDTTAIPELERQIRNLRKRIRDKRDIKRKSPIKKIEKEVSNIGSEMEDSTKQLKNEIKDLKLRIDGRIEAKNVSLESGNSTTIFISGDELEIFPVLNDKTCENSFIPEKR